MSSSHSRLARESKTVGAMISLYCHGHHRPEGGLCPECSELAGFAQDRLDRCPFQENKTTCAKCPVHCYRSGMRDRIRTVMRYSGPRMLYRHPIMALLHIADGMRKEPADTEL